MMPCSRDKHVWKDIFTVNGTDYEPGYIVWWCSLCGDAVVQTRFDGRTIKETRYRIEEPPQAQEKTE